MLLWQVLPTYSFLAYYVKIHLQSLMLSCAFTWKHSAIFKLSVALGLKAEDNFFFSYIGVNLLFEVTTNPRNTEGFWCDPEEGIQSIYFKDWIWWTSELLAMHFAKMCYKWIISILTHMGIFNNRKMYIYKYVNSQGLTEAKLLWLDVEKQLDSIRKHFL